MDDWKDIGSNIIKLEGYGVYVTYIDNEVYTSEMMSHSGLPTLDPDKNIEWEKMLDPPNQDFLNLVNARFVTKLTMNDFGKIMKVSDILSHAKQQKEANAGRMTDSQARWMVKNLREKEK